MIYLYPCKPKELPPVSELFDELDNDETWIAEYKKNGWRCEIIKEAESVHIMTSNKTYAPVKTALASTLWHLPSGTQLDGEIILQARTGRKTEESLYLFDILRYNGQPTWHMPLHQRKEILMSVFIDYLSMDKNIDLAKGFVTQKKDRYRIALEEGHEGIVIKHLHSPYLIGYTKINVTPHWLKVKRVEKHVRVGA